MSGTGAMADRANRDACAAVELACRIHGRQRGWHLAARALGVSERTARAIAAGETSGATIPTGLAQEARMVFRRQRAAMLREELAALEDENVGMGGAAVRGAR